MSRNIYHAPCIRSKVVLSAVLEEFLFAPWSNGERCFFFGKGGFFGCSSSSGHWNEMAELPTCPSGIQFI